MSGVGSDVFHMVPFKLWRFVLPSPLHHQYSFDDDHDYDDDCDYTEYRTPHKEQESLSGLGFLFENGCVLR